MHYSIKRTPLAAAMLLALNTHLYSPQADAAPGDVVGVEFQVNTYTTSTQGIPSIAMDADGDFVVAWESLGQDGNGYGIVAQRYNADGTAAGGEFRVNTYTTNDQRVPSIAMDADGDFVVTWWSSFQDGSLYGIYAQRYNADGTAAGGEFQVNTYTTSRQYGPSIAMDADGDFVVAWNSGGDGDLYGIYTQRYNADGTTAGGEFQVNTYITSQQKFPSIAMDADGDFVVAWMSKGQDGDGYGIYAQRYNANGTAAGSEFQVNNYTIAWQFSPSIAMDADGDFVVVWASQFQDGDNYGIVAQRYNADGTAAGGEFKVNTYTTNAQLRPSIAMDADGDFAVIWGSNGQEDGSSYGIYAQRYNADGTTAGGEFRVNTYTTNDQKRLSIAMDADGDFVVAWQSDGQDGDLYGIYAQRYAGAAKTVDLNLVVQDDTDPVSAGNNFVYSLITTNNGSGIAMDVNLSDPLPAGVSYVSNDGAGVGWNCTEAAGTVSCNKPFMAAAETNTIFLTVTADALGTANNTVTVNAAQTDLNAADNTDTQTTIINDTTAPVITLLGTSPMTVALNTTFTDPGSSVTDNVDTGLTATVTGTVDTSTAGSYVLSYDVTDAAGNVATTVIRTVNVIVDDIAPVITLLGDNPMSVVQNSTFTDPGSSVTDNVDIGLTATVTGSVDTATVGTYVLSYNVTDASGNMAITVIRTVNVTDGIAPVITLLGDNPISLVQNSTFTDPGSSITDNVDIGLAATVSGSVDTSTAGSYDLSYDVTDAAGNVATTVIRTVNVVDVVAPVITLVGNNPMSVVQNSAFTDPGSSVTDNADIGLIATVTGSVDTSTAGSYELSYNVTDAAGNVATTVIRTVNVTDGVAPVITLLGDNPISLVQNTPFTDPGSSVTDNIDTGLTATVSGSVDTAIVGSYELSYNVTDAAGNAATTVTRTVEVTAIPVSGGGGGSFGMLSMLFALPLWLRRRFKN